MNFSIFGQSGQASLAGIGRRAQFWLYRAYLKLGRAGVAALLLLIAALLFWQIYIGWLAQEISQRRSEAESSVAILSAAKPVAPVLTTELPAASAFMPRVQSAYAILAEHGFEVTQASYQQSVDKAGKLRRLTVELPMSGRYASLRAALAALMQQSGIAVESISIERKSIGEEVLAVRIRLSLLGVTE
jgi:hypothetical protein